MFSMKKFCSDETDTRWYLHKPFAWHGFLYATNGHIAVRVPADGSMPDTEEKIGAQIGRLFETNNFTGLEPLPMYATVVLPKCADCDGQGKVKPTDECKECRGEGFVEWDSDWNTYTADCKGCDGDGNTEVHGLADKMCPSCDGAGLTVDVPVTIGGITINYRYLQMMEEFPNLLVAKLADRVYPDAIPFTFDGGSGIVMPMLPKLKQKENTP